MIEKLITLLRCINCGSTNLSVLKSSSRENGKIICNDCKAEYLINNGIPVMIKNKEILKDQGIRIFHEYSNRYDSWFFSDKGRVLFMNELRALRELLKGVNLGFSLEIGVGTGEFASALGIKYGVDPALNALLKARERGVVCVQGIAEELPFRDGVFDNVFMIVTICYVKDINKALSESNRVLKENGNLIVGFINKDSSWGRVYLEKKRKGHLFYVPAKFYNFDEVRNLLEQNGFNLIKVVSTLYQEPSETPMPEEARLGFVKNAGFITILARKSVKN